MCLNNSQIISLIIIVPSLISSVIFNSIFKATLVMDFCSIVAFRCRSIGSLRICQANWNHPCSTPMILDLGCNICEQVCANKSSSSDLTDGLVLCVCVFFVLPGIQFGGTEQAYWGVLPESSRDPGPQGGFCVDDRTMRSQTHL